VPALIFRESPHNAGIRQAPGRILPVGTFEEGASTMGPVSLGNARAWAPVLAGVLLISGITFAIVCYLHFEERVQAYQLMDDAAYSAGLAWYTGALSYAVVLMWCASAAVCGFAGFIVRDSPEPQIRVLSWFVLVLSASSLWLTLDDLFLVHEQMARHLVGRESQHAGEGAIFTLYAGIMAICFWRFRGTIARTDYPLLIGAVASLRASAAIDVAFQLELDGNNLFRETVLSVSWGPPAIDITEEILKLNGAILWLAYGARVALLAVRDGMAAPGPEMAG
jgi:hypothetical protein